MAYNILLVDDSATIRSVIEKTIRLADIPLNQLYHAGNGAEALAVLRSNWIDLVLADINMPVMNGIEMIEHMAKDNLMETIPVVVVSSEGSSTRIEHLKSKGVRAWIRKPFTPEIIKNIVDDILGLARVESGARAAGGNLEVVSRVFADVLEKQAFLFAEPAPEDLLVFPEAGTVVASVGFDGDMDGTIVLTCPGNLALEMAANMMGVDASSDSAREKTGDALKEVLNVTCGNVMTALAGMRPVFNMAPPVIMECTAGAWDYYKSSADTVGLLVDGQPILLNFSMRERVA